MVGTVVGAILLFVVYVAVEWLTRRSLARRYGFAVAGVLDDVRGVRCAFASWRRAPRVFGRSLRTLPVPALAFVFVACVAAGVAADSETAISGALGLAALFVAAALDAAPFLESSSNPADFAPRRARVVLVRVGWVLVAAVSLIGVVRLAATWNLSTISPRSDAIGAWHFVQQPLGALLLVASVVALRERHALTALEAVERDRTLGSLALRCAWATALAQLFFGGVSPGFALPAGRGGAVLALLVLATKLGLVAIVSTWFRMRGPRWRAHQSARALEIALPLAALHLALASPTAPWPAVGFATGIEVLVAGLVLFAAWWAPKFSANAAALAVRIGSGIAAPVRAVALVARVVVDDVLAGALEWIAAFAVRGFTRLLASRRALAAALAIAFVSSLVLYLAVR